uniref:RluA family pseudouridine synthase n=1 Tax=Thaumasiovibrio occultus TaxID=1891184 RepID=UPI000B363C58|nr:RluA family pseudouridine synthase [Thaumasiovibrio occultus]
MPHSIDPRFHRFANTADLTDDLLPPRQFTYPFYYQPHALSKLAASELKEYLSTQVQWQHNFGSESEISNDATGKMFGVLIVKNAQGELGYLRGFSGKVANSNHHTGFVPPVFDMLEEDGFFIPEQNNINQISAQIKLLMADASYAEQSQALLDAKSAFNSALGAHKLVMQHGRARRKALRQTATENPSAETSELLKELSQESVREKLILRDLKLEWESKVAQLQADVDVKTTQIDALKKERATRSHALQQALFAQYQFLNAQGEVRNLNELFAETTPGIPPAGAGECAAPKLLHYAYQHGYTPLALAEFWWGQSPKSEIRRHGQFYPSCQGKCKPILTHMLQGLDVEPNPLLAQAGNGDNIDVIYADDHMAIINKPAEFLSVPGKTIDDSVYARMKARFPNATGPLIVHRLDMSTSGLMVIALSERANKHLQQQFIQRTIQKRYCALVEGVVTEDEGTISLPMRGDLYDRPRQLVCFEHGKPADTFWQVIERRQERTKLWLYPKTGRTHQLRVHCAHQQGLNMPMVGDDLYGTRANRLHLHAEQLVLTHPITQESMTFEVPAEF